MTSEERELGSKMFSALASPARLHILEYLSEQSASVNQISEAVGLKQSMTSQHLSALLHAGAVVKHPEGNTRIYSLRGPRIARIVELARQFCEIHMENLRGLPDDYQQT